MTSNYLWDRVDPAERDIVKGYLKDVPVRVGDLANALGIPVIRSPLEINISGLIQPSKESKSGYEIRVNKFENVERQRFTVAHEIGHYLLHRDFIGSGIVDSIMYRSALTSKKETEANRIAADIIMPSASLRNELARTGRATEEGVPEELAKIFRVSLPAMRVRLGLT